MQVEKIVGSLFVLVIVTATKSSPAANTCFQRQYALDTNFAKNIPFENVSDIAINQKEQHILVLQRSHPPVSVWSTNGTLLFTWDTQEIGYPHSLTINATTTAETTVWITDMAGELAAGKVYGHCIKQFTYTGTFIQSIGTCGFSTNGSDLDPLQFDKVTDLALNSRGYVYVTDGDIGGVNNRVLVFDPNHNLVDVWNKDNKPGSEPLQFNLPHSVDIDWCDRVWITDTQNHRIQIISSNGTFLEEWNCFENSLVYGIDVCSDSGFVVITAKSIDGESEIIFLPIQVNDCSQLANFGTCTIHRRLVVNQQNVWLGQGMLSASSMLHSVAVDSVTGNLYLAMLPGALPPLKFSPVPLPPRSNSSSCSGALSPNPWPRIWNATILLTPFFAEDLHTAQVEYDDDLQAMYIILYGPNSEVKEYLNIGDSTYIITRNFTRVTCSGPHDYGWTTPARDWLAPHKCECKGGLNISGIETVAWTCPMHKLRDWYWLHSSNGSVWRMLFNNQSNPTSLPVIGEYTMVHFSAYGDKVTQLETVHRICTGNFKQPSNSSSTAANPVKGFMYAGCSTISSFPNWPEFFHMTATMIPVVLNNATPLPTQVVYDWERESQHTIMCEASQTYNAYLIHNSTYILNRNLETEAVQCLSHLPFGPPKPNWMTLDNCKCKGTITDNPSLTPWNNTIIAVCPVAENRVFWTWFTDDVGFSPILFFETLTPADEGTGLALADYHAIHKGSVLTDMQDFEVPSKCQVT